MKAFREWEGQHSPGEYACQTWAEGWCGALEWVLDNVCAEAWTDADIEDAIKDELEETQ